MCIYCERVGCFFPYVCECKSMHARLCAYDGDEVKGFTLYFSVCVYPFWDPRCTEEAYFHSLFAFQCILYTL